MSYQVLARKWRPRRFSEMVGQQHVLKALENALNQDRLHHAYLFTGTRGVGKTTIARIFAKCLNCERGVSAEPCGSCGVCQSVDEGRFLDLMEIDAASHTGVDAIRELLDNTQYTPTQGKYKVYLIDEVHMLSGSAFNALLKTLEEPPAHVKFLLATTDPQKLPVTVLSRCLQFNLKSMSSRQIFDHLRILLEKEMISFEEEALQLIAQAADGSMRDALSLADQAIAHSNENLQAAEVRSMLGMVDSAYVEHLIEALLQKDAQALLSCVEKMALDSPSYQSVLAELLDLLHKLIVEQVSDADKHPKIKSLAKQFKPEELQLYYQIALKGRADLALAPDPRQGMEICLLRMILFRPEKLIAPASGSNTQFGDENSNAAGASSSTAKADFDALKDQLQKKKPELNPKTSDKEQNQKPPHEQTRGQGLETKVEPTTTSSVVNTEKAQKVSEKRATTQTAPANPDISGNSSRFAYANIPDKWTQIVLSLELTGPALQVAKNSNFEKLGARQFKLSFEKKFAMLVSEQVKHNLHTTLNAYFGTELDLLFKQEALKQPTPEHLCQALDMEKSRYAEQSILEDTTVRILLDEFDASVQEGSASLLH